MIITTLISITASFIILIFISFAKHLDWLQVVSIGGLIITALFGWGALACLYPVSTKKEKAIVTQILKGKHVAVVSTICDYNKKDEKEELSNVLFTGNEIDYINDTTKFYWKLGINSYGFEVKKELKFDIK